jgi:hypothetical protein
MTNTFQDNTVRKSLLDVFVANYAAAVDNPTPPTGQKHYGIQFDVVKLGPLGNQDFRKRSAIGIVADKEVKTLLFPLREPRFKVIVEFHYTINQGDEDPAVIAERLLGVVTQIMYDDSTLGGLAIMCDDVDNSVDLDTYADRSVKGTVTWEVLYRHNMQSIYDPDPSI